MSIGREGRRFWGGVAASLLFLHSAAAEARPKAKIATPGKSAAEKKAPAAKPPVEGYWETSAGQVEIKRDGKHLTGKLVAPADGSSLKAGQKVLDGLFEDDNVSAELRLELVSNTCRGDATKAFAVLLLTRSGKLTGGVSTKAACAANVSAISFVRSAEQSPQSKSVASNTAVPGSEQYDARGKRSAAMPKQIRAIMDAGSGDLQSGLFEAARAKFSEVVAKAPAVGEAYNGVGVTFAMRNDYESAIEWYKKGLEAAPGFGDLYYNLACSYAQLGRKPMALRYFKLAVTKGYAETEAIDADHDLDSLREEPEFIVLRRQLGSDTPMQKDSEGASIP